MNVRSGLVSALVSMVICTALRAQTPDSNPASPTQAPADSTPPKRVPREIYAQIEASWEGKDVPADVRTYVSASKAAKEAALAQARKDLAASKRIPKDDVRNEQEREKAKQDALARVKLLQDKMVFFQISLYNNDGVPPQPGEVGILHVQGIYPQAQIKQVIDDRNALVAPYMYASAHGLEQSGWLWIEGLPTVGKSDDQMLDYNNVVFKMVGTKSYTNAAGSTTTVPHYRVIEMNPWLPAGVRFAE